MNLNPFVNLLGNIISIYQLVLVAYIIMKYLFLFKIVNPYNRFVLGLNDFLEKAIDPVLNKIRRYLPRTMMIDLSPLALFLALIFLKDLLYTYLYH